MKRFRNALFAIVGLSLTFAGAAASADAQTSAKDRQVSLLVRTLVAQVDDFQYGLNYELKNNPAAGASVNAGDVNRALRNLQAKVSEFDENFARKRDNRDDVGFIITAARDVDGALATIQLDQRLQNDWAEVKKSVDSLAVHYGITPNWNYRISNATRGTNRDPQRTVSTPSYNRGGLSGTYTLDTTRSENIADIVSASGVESGNRQDLESKLEAPEQITLDVRGNQVTLSTSKASPVTVVADGTEKVERGSGRTVRLKATLRGDELVVSSLGGETDYTVTFTSMDGGRTLKVTRRITTDYLNETIFAESFYNRSDNVAGPVVDPPTATPDDNDTSGGYSTNDPGDRAGSNLPNPTIAQARTGEFIVPNGMILTANLENLVDTKISQNNDRFKLTVQSPMEFRGAMIEGYISGVGRSGRVSGSSNITFNFQSITLRDGQRYDFAGTLQGVKDQYGKAVKVDAEGTVRGDSQTNETAKRGGLGAGAGAIIGAITGGLKGAAIGAVIGGGAGAGSVIATGREDIRLLQGTTLTIQSSSPIRGQDRNSEN
jgi:hypothetical protein